MRKFTVEGISPEMARGLYAAFAGFDAQLLVDADGNHSGVAISFTDGDGEAREAIAAIRQFVEIQEN
jgi:hypothetical protein